MALPYETNTLDVVPESAREHYIPNDDATGYVLAIDGAGGLKGALAKERLAARNYEKELRLLGETPEERAPRIAQMNDVQATFEQFKKHAAQTQTGLQNELAQARINERATIAATVLEVALTKVKVTEEGAQVIRDKLIKRVRIESVDGKRVVQIMQADGKTPMLVNGKPASFADLANEARGEFPSLFYGSGAGGGGAPTKNQSVPTSKTITRTAFDSLSAVERSAKMTAGYKLVD